MIPRNTENYREKTNDENTSWYNKIFLLILRYQVFDGTYKLKQKRVFSERSDASCKSKNEHDPPDHHEEPDRVQTPQVCDGRDVGENTL